MADDDGLVSFLNDEKTVDANGSTYRIVDTANPVKWGRLAQSLVLSIVAGISLGVQTTVNQTVDGASDLIGGLISFVGGVVFDPAGSIPNPGRPLEELPTPGEVPGTFEGTGVIGAIFTPLLNFFQGGTFTDSLSGLGAFAYPGSVLLSLAVVYVVVRGGRAVGQKLGGE